MKKLGFALGAGGARGIAHIGFLQAMEENNIKPYCISGSSMGSVVGACYSVGITPKKMLEIIVGIKRNDLMDLAANPLKNQALLKSKKMLSKIQEFLGEKTFKDLEIPFSCVAVDLYTGKSIILSGERDVASSVAASSSIPGIFKPVQTEDGLLLVDGAVRDRVPVKAVRKLGAEVIVAVDVLGDIREQKDKKFSLPSVLMRVIDIYDEGVSKQKIKRHKPDILIKPDLGEMSQYKFNRFEEAYEAGYKCGLAHVDEIKKLLND